MYSVRSKDSQGTQKSAPKPNSMLVSKIYNNPITSSVSGYYLSAKNSNRVFNFSLGLAESTLKWVSTPMVRRLDSYASWMEGEVAKLTQSMYIQPKTVDDIYLNVRFLLDVASNLASSTMSFSKDQFSKFSARNLITESMRLSAKYNNRDALMGLLRVDMVHEIHHMSDTIMQYLDDIRAKAADEEHMVISRMVLTLEQGLQRLLTALPEAKRMLDEAKEKIEEVKEKIEDAKDEVMEKVKIPVIRVTSPRELPLKNRRMSPAPIDTQSIGSVRQAVSQREQTAMASAPQERKIIARWTVIEESDSEGEEQAKDEVVSIPIEDKAEPEPIQQSEVSGNVTVVSQDDLKEMRQAEQVKPQEVSAAVEASTKAPKKRSLNMDSTRDFPALPHVEHAKRTWADVAHEHEVSQPLPASNVQIFDMSALDHESRFRTQATAPVQASSMEQYKQDQKPAEDFPALSRSEDKADKESEQPSKESYLDALKYGTHAKSATEWHVYHSRPVIGHAHRLSIVQEPSFHPAHLTRTPFVKTAADSNPFDALERLNAQEARDNIEAAEYEESARLAHEAYLHSHRGMWQHALPAKQDKKHHFAHHAKVHQPRAIETLADSNPFSAFREEIEEVEMKQEEQRAGERVQVIDSLVHERHAARLRLKSTKKLEEAERSRRLAEITEADAANTQSRAADKKAVLELEEAERKVRLAEYIAKLRANRAQQNVEREISNVDERVLSVSRAAESQQNRELSAHLEEEERARIIAEEHVCDETASLERAATLSQVRRLEEEERLRRVKDLAVKNSGELDLPMVGSPMM